GATPYTNRICPKVPSRPPSIALLTMCCGISFTLPVSLVPPLPLFLPRRLLQLPCQPRDLGVRGVPAGDVLRPFSPPTVTIYRQLSPPAVTVCRDGSCNPPSPPVACRAGRESTPHGGRAAGRGQRWHGKCSLCRSRISTPQEALDADRDLFNTALSLAYAERNELRALVQLYKALGGGW